MQQCGIVQAVLSVISYALRIMLTRKVVGKDQGVAACEQGEHAGQFLGGNPGKALPGHLAELLQKALGHKEILLSVLARIVELLTAQAIVFQYGIGQLERRIDKDSVCSVKLLGIHSSHGCAEDDVRAAFLNYPAQECDGFVRPDRKVGRNHLRLRQQDTERPGRSAASAGRESVYEKQCLAGHQRRACELE